MSTNENDRPDLQLANDRMLENRPPAPFTRWEDYEASLEAQRHPFKQLDNAQEIFESQVRTLIGESIARGNEDQVSLSVWIDLWPGSDATDALVDALGSELILEIQWENLAAPGTDKVDLVFWWE